MKKLLLAILLFMMIGITLLSGCSKVEYSVVESSTGKISKQFLITLDETELRSQVGMDETEIEDVKEYILIKLNTYVQNQKDDYVQRVDADAYLAAEEKTNLKNAVRLEAGIDPLNASRIVYLEEFDTVDAYYYFIEYSSEDAEDKDGTITEQTLFFNKYTQKTQTIYSAKDGEGNNITMKFLLEMKNYITAEYGTSVYNGMKLPALAYSYLTYNKRLRTDADIVEKTPNGKMHTWVIPLDNLDREINFYTTTPRREIWYVFALLATGIFMIVLAIVFHNREKQKKLDSNNVLPN